VIEPPFLMWAMTHFFLAGWMFFFIISAIDNVGATLVGMFLMVSLAATLWLGWRALKEVQGKPVEGSEEALRKLDEDFGSTPHKGPLVITEIAVDEKKAKKLDLLNEEREVEREA
jgi:hypothetical protein